MPELLPEQHQLVLLPRELFLRVLQLPRQVPVILQQVLIVVEGTQEGRRVRGVLEQLEVEEVETRHPAVRQASHSPEEEEALHFVVVHKGRV